MRGKIIFTCSLLLLFSCEKFTLTRVYRAQVLPEIGRHCPDSTTAHDSLVRRADTIVYLSAVSVPASYDWRRDTSYGGVPCELLFLKNGETLFSVSTGASSCVGTSPETHHIIAGQLYTEYNTLSETVICRNGEQLLRYQGREVLRGLLIRDGDIYSLGCDKDKGGVVFRCNGELQFRQDDAVVFGDFSSLSPRSGALYEDEGKICFCFKNGTACFQVLDGGVSQVRTNVTAPRVEDLLIFKGQPYYVANYGKSVLVATPSRNFTLPSDEKWKDIRLFFYKDKPCIIAAGEKERSICCPLLEFALEKEREYFSGEGLFIYPYAPEPYAIGYDGGNLKIQSMGGEYVFVRDSSYFFGHGCACMADGSMYLAVTPREYDQTPFVWHKGVETPCPVEGYITGIDVVISPPS